MGAARTAAVISIIAVATGITVSQMSSSGGLVKIQTNSPGLLAGSGTYSDHLRTTVTTDGTTMSGTGSAGSALSADPGFAVLTYGLFGDGSDGACAFDGVTTPVAGANLSGTTYTMTRNVFCNGATIATGISVTGPYAFHDLGTLTLTGTAKIHRNGNSATSATGGAGLGAGYLGASSAGGNGNNNSCGGGGASASTINWCSNSGGGGGNPGATGGNCKGGGSGQQNGAISCSGGTITNVSTAGTVNPPWYRYVVEQVNGRFGGTVVLTGGTGGGGGATALNNGCIGGGGGGGAAPVVVLAHKIEGSGSIEAKGGNGFDGCTNLAPSYNLNGAGGGGGGGGSTVTVVIGVGSFPTINVSGGTKGLGHSTSGSAKDGGDGGPGKAYKFRAQLGCPAGGC